MKGRAARLTSGPHPNPLPEGEGNERGGEGVCGWRVVLLVWAASLAILGGGALLFRQPGYMDAYYYYHVAANVAQGRGLVEGFVWNYLPAPQAVSHPSNLYWMPLTALVVAPSLRLLGESFRAAQVPCLLVASLVPVLAYVLGRQLFTDRRYALFMAATTLFSGYYFAYWSAVDSFALFALTANLALLCMVKVGDLLEASGRGHASQPTGTGPHPLGEGIGSRPHSNPLPGGEGTGSGRRRELSGMAAWAAGVGFFVALSHLTRADGVLLLGVFAVALTHQVRRSGRGSGLPQYPVTQPASTRGSDAISPFPLFPSSPLAHRRWVARWRQPFLLVVIAVAAYVLAMSPWFARNWALVGAPLPPAGLKTLFLREYNEFYGYGVDPGLRYYLDWGLLNILRSKAEGLGRSLLVLFGMEYYLVPLAALGIWRLRRDRRHWPFAIYGLGLYLTMSLAFTFPAARGSMLHSGAALVPWLAGMALVGLDRAVDLAARRLRHWNVPVARRNFAVILVAFSVAVSLFLLWQKGSTWDERYQKYEGLASWFAAEDPGAVVMVVDPPGYYFSSQRPAVVIPSDGPAAALDVARRYGARYLALEAVHARPFQGLYRGEVEVPGMERVRTMGDTQIYRLAW